METPAPPELLGSVLTDQFESKPTLALEPNIAFVPSWDSLNKQVFDNQWTTQDFSELIT